MIDFGIVCLLLGTAYAFNRPGFFLKRANGQISWLGWIIFWPYFIPNIVALWLFRRRDTIKAFQPITDRVWLGGRLGPKHATKLLGASIGAVLDVAAEFPETESLRRLAGYRSLPVLDSGAPSLEQLQAGVSFIAQEQRIHPVYVHCAMGHGRSAVFVLAWLLQSGRVRDVADGFQQLRALRPGVGFSSVQQVLLLQFERQLRLSPSPAAPTISS